MTNTTTIMDVPAGATRECWAEAWAEQEKLEARAAAARQGWRTRRERARAAAAAAEAEAEAWTADGALAAVAS